MIKLRISVAALMIAIVSSANAAAGDYLNAQLAIADVDGYDEGIAGVVTYGMPLPQVHRNFFVEGEFTMTLADPDAVINGTSVEISYFTLGAYAVYAHPLSDSVKLRGRAGLLYYDTDVSTTGSGIRASDDGLELTYGIGATFNVAQNMDVIAEYTVIESDISHISAGVQYRF